MLSGGRAVVHDVLPVLRESKHKVISVSETSPFFQTLRPYTVGESSEEVSVLHYSDYLEKRVDTVDESIISDSELTIRVD